MIHQGDALTVLRTLPEESVQCCVTSPPYFGLRDYGHEGQIGLEPSPSEYVARLVDVFEEVRRVLKADGVCWLNLGDSYAGSWGAQGRPQGKGQMAGRSVASARQIGSHPRFLTRTGTRGKEEGYKPKDLFGISWRVAFALQDAGWWLRCDVIWNKQNCMPDSTEDRPTRSHEYVFLLTKSESYYYNHEAIKEPAVGDHPRNVKPSLPSHVPGASDHTGLRKHGDKQRGHGRRHAGFNSRWKEDIEHALTRNRRSVWTINTRPFKEAHFATMPEELARLCILSGSRPGGRVLDPFAGAGTTGLVAEKLGRQFEGIELNPLYVEMAERRIRNVAPLFAEIA